MNVKILCLLLLTVTGGLAQVPPPATTNGLSHEEIVRRASSKPATATAETAAAVPDWSVTNSPRPANASANVTVPAATPSKADEEAARATAAARLAQLRAAAATNAPSTLPSTRPPGIRTPRSTNLPTANLRSVPATPAAPVDTTSVIPTTTPAAATGAETAFGAIAIRPPAAPNNISEPDKIYPAGTIDFPSSSLDQILYFYAELVGRNMLRPTSLDPKKIDIVLKQTTPLTKLEVVRMFEAAMYLNGVSVINVGEKFVTVMLTAEAFKIPGIISTNDVSDLPVMGTIVTRVVQLKYVKPSEMQGILTPFISGTAPNPIIPVESSGILVLRDNVANVKRMLEMIEKVDIVAQSEIISEVIPIKYAKAEEIASALSSVGGGSGGTVGTRAAPTTAVGSGANRLGSVGQPGSYGQPGATGMPGTTPAPAAGGASFGDRVRNLITKAGQSGDLTILGTTKIIADIRSNSLLVFASRQDMEMIKEIVSKLDVVLAQVLIETIILDVTLSDSWNLGVSGAQNPYTFNKNVRNTAGGGNNGAPFFSSLTNAFPGNLPSGINYFGSLGSEPSFEVAVSAFAADNRVNVIQKPRIQTSHATPASIFIGSTVPYVSGTYYGYGAGTGGSSSYQQLRVGIGLNVTPFINQDGLVVMKIDETIDELDGSTEIQNVGAVPNTKSSTLSAEIAVRDRETIILGGIIRNSDTKNKSGVPLLKDIPLLGALFSSRDSSKKRQELIVLMRPTVLRTPEAAALQVEVEKNRLPGIRAAEKQLDKVELERANQEKKKQQTSSKERPSTSSQPSFDQPAPFTPEEEKLIFAPPQ